MSLSSQQSDSEVIQEQTQEQAEEQSQQDAEKQQQMREAALNPFPMYRTMRESDPVVYNEENKFWEVYRYDDVQRVVNNYATFSSERVVSSEQVLSEKMREEGWSEEELPTKSILSLDPPRHRQLRSLISQAFTPRAITQLAPRITNIVNELLDDVAATGKMDIIHDLSYPLPVIVIAEMLGVPVEDQAQFKLWSDGVLSGEEASMKAIREMNAYFREVIAQRRKNPTDDLISGLVAAEVNGEHLTEQELLSFCVILLVAGNVTTTNLLGSAVLCFDDHPEVMDQLREDPSLLPTAIEEVLRYYSPVQRLARAAAVDTEIGGKEIKAGQIILPVIGSANRDERQFPDPDTFDFKRIPNRHLAFGHGIHACIGAPLARLETKIAFEVLLARFRDIKRVREVELEPATPGFYGVRSLPITFTA